jgi:hypothetical protein
MGTIKDIHNLLIDVGKQAYREGRKHQKLDFAKCPDAYKQTPKRFEDTKIYATILEGYIETDS